MISSDNIFYSFVFESDSERKIIESFIDGYVNRYHAGNIDLCRFGGCIEFSEAFNSQFPDSEIWSSLELPEKLDDIPLVLSVSDIKKLLKKYRVSDIADLGGLGGHDVVVWRGFVFDSAGISSFEKITRDFYTLSNVHWFRTA